MIKDTSVNNLLTDGYKGVKYVHLPEDFDYEKSWLVYDYSISNQTNTLSQNACFYEYELVVTATTNDSEKTNNLVDAVVNYLNAEEFIVPSGYGGSIIDINLVSESRSTALNKAQNIYQSTMTFNVVWLPNT